MDSTPMANSNQSARVLKGGAQSFSVQVLVPIYNEGENVVRLYESLEAESIPYDVLRFVYDFDQDTTLPYIAELSAKDSRVVAEKNEYGRGVVNALRWGFAHCQDGPVIVTMGDNSDKLSIIPEMLRLWEQGAEIVSPSRYMPGGKQHGGEFLKTLLSRVAGVFLNKCGFPTSDATNNFKLYDGAWLRAQEIQSDGGFEVALELCYRAYSQGKTISELPTEWWDRTLGESNFKLWAWIPRYLRWYLLALGSLIKRKFS